MIERLISSNVEDSIRQTRRGWLKSLAIASSGVLGGGWLEAAGAQAATKRLSCRLGQITDVHVQPERGARDGFIKCLHHIQSQKEAPQLLLNTGDCIMDSMQASPARTKLQWDLWKELLRSECSLPVRHAVGNHDCWGIDKTKSGTTGREPLWGKKWALDSLGLAQPYYSFDLFGWHFIALDSVEPFQNAYKARLGEEQMAWLKSDLAGLPPNVPVLVMSHIPIVSPGGLLNSASVTEEQDLQIGGGLMHLDSKEIHTLLREAGNVRLCLSGHVHINDRAEYDGITYISSGAVSSGWWKEVHLDRFDYGYALLDLFADGSFDYRYVPYGWKTVSVEKETEEEP